MPQHDLFSEHESWKRPLATSAILHGAFAGLLVVLSGVMGGASGESWGGTTAGGGAMSATLVSRAALPLPPNEAPPENVVATESQGLAQSEPRRSEPVPEEAIPIPSRDARKKPDQKRSVTEANKPKPPQDNVVPFGEGGPAAVPATTFNTSTGTGGMSFAGGGDFGSRFSWYVDAVRRKVSSNWLQYEVDPNIRASRRVYVIFDIQRDGSVDRRSIQVEQSSGIPSLDQSAVRALQRIDSFGPLPPDYRGSKVSVEFWFEYKR